MHIYTNIHMYSKYLHPSLVPYFQIHLSIRIYIGIDIRTNRLTYIRTQCTPLFSSSTCTPYFNNYGVGGLFTIYLSRSVSRDIFLLIALTISYLPLQCLSISFSSPSSNPIHISEKLFSPI